MAKRKYYHYPKGYIDKKTGKPKTGFMSKKDGALIYVKGNIDNIKSGNIPYQSLSRQEKAIYRAAVSPVRQNTFYYKGKQLYDPTGYLRQVIDSFPATKGRNNLNNLIDPKFWKTLTEGDIRPAQKMDLFNISQKRIKEGKKQKYYTREGTNLDIISRLNRYVQKGYNVEVNGKKGKQALEELRRFEADQIQKKLQQSGQKNGNIQIFYQDISFNPATKEIKIKADENSTQTTDFTNTP